MSSVDVRNSRNDPAFLRHYILVLLREARSRRHSPSFHATLLEWVQNARRDLVAAKAARVPAQGDLFGSTA